MLLDISRKFRKKIPIFGKQNTSTNGQEFWDISTKVPGPPNNPGYMAIDGGAAPWFGGSYLGLQDFS